MFDYYAAMQREDWVAICAHELQRRWRTVDPAQLDDLAGDLWKNEHLRELPPAQAATAWLAPIASEQVALWKFITCKPYGGSTPSRICSWARAWSSAARAWV